MTLLYDNEKLAPLGRKLAIFGQRAYTRQYDGHYQLRLTLPSDTQGTDKISDFISTHMQTPPDAAALNRLDATLKSDGFDQFIYLTSGNDGDVFIAKHATGHDYALRLAAFPQGREWRPVSPMVVQPYKTIVTNWNHVLEIMPLVQVLTQSHTKPAANTITSRLSATDGKILTDILTQTAFSAGHYCTPFVLKDIAVLPNGTPIQPDPGQIQYVDSTMPHKPDLMATGLRMMFTNVYARPQPAQFHWFTPDGRFQQDEFFKNPVKRTPYYHGFHIAQQ